MRILALETTTEYCSVAVLADGAAYERCELVGQRHSEVLIGMVDAVLAAAGLRLGQMDGVAFGKGPGSFTGVRIACGAAQGLALGAHLPVVGMVTLLALAEASGQSKVIAALDARMGEIYHAAYQKQQGIWQVVCEPSLCLPHLAPGVEGEGWFGCGSGFAVHGEALATRYASQLSGVDAQAVPQAAAIGRLAERAFAEGAGVAAAQALPLYLRDKVALKTAERV